MAIGTTLTAKISCGQFVKGQQFVVIIFNNYVHLISYIGLQI